MNTAQPLWQDTRSTEEVLEMSWFNNLEFKFWRKRIYKTVKGIARTCLVSYYACSNKYPDATNIELYTMVLATRDYTREQIKDIMTRPKPLQSKPLRLFDVVHGVVIRETPIELDSIINTPTKPKFEYYVDNKSKPKRVETYTSLAEIVNEVIPDDI